MRFGLVFNSKVNDTVGVSQAIAPDMLSRIPESKKSDDEVSMLVKCTKCGDYMDFHDDRYTCSTCHSHTVQRSSLYERLDQDINQWYSDNDIDPTKLDIVE